jgi:hypothetical protein
MNDASQTVRRAAVEAGAGRPFRFSLVLGDGEGSLLFWLGGRWALGFGLLVVTLFAAAGVVSGSIAGPDIPRQSFAFAGACVGAMAVAMHLRPRKVLFLRREGTWCWRERWSLLRSGWRAITEEVPLRLERELLSTVEGWTLYAGPERLFSYLGDPSIGRNVTAAFQAAGVPLRTVIKRTAVRDESE